MMRDLFVYLTVVFGMIERWASKGDSVRSVFLCQFQDSGGNRVSSLIGRFLGRVLGVVSGFRGDLSFGDMKIENGRLESFLSLGIENCFVVVYLVIEPWICSVLLLGVSQSIHLLFGSIICYSVSLFLIVHHMAYVEFLHQ